MKCALIDNKHIRFSFYTVQTHAKYLVHLVPNVFKCFRNICEIYTSSSLKSQYMFSWTLAQTFCKCCVREIFANVFKCLNQTLPTLLYPWTILPMGDITILIPGWNKGWVVYKSYWRDQTDRNLSLGWLDFSKGHLTLQCHSFYTKH